MNEHPEIDPITLFLSRSFVVVILFFVAWMVLAHFGMVPPFPHFN